MRITPPGLEHDDLTIPPETVADQLTMARAGVQRQHDAMKSRVVPMLAVAAGTLVLSLPARAAGDVSVAVRVEGSGGTGVVLQRRIFEAEGFDPVDPSLWPSTWAPVCSAPCEATVPRGSYRIDGDGVRPSHSFEVDPTNGGDRIVLRVKPASEAGHTAGLVLLGVGSAALVAGVVLAFLGGLTEGFAGLLCFLPPCTNGGAAELAAGAATLTLGGTFVFVGAALTVSNAASTVTQSAEPAARAFTFPLVGVRF